MQHLQWLQNHKLIVASMVTMMIAFVFLLSDSASNRVTTAAQSPYISTSCLCR
jgi:hypothetical protein